MKKLQIRESSHFSLCLTVREEAAQLQHQTCRLTNRWGLGLSRAEASLPYILGGPIGKRVTMQPLGKDTVTIVILDH